MRVPSRGDGLRRRQGGGRRHPSASHGGVKGLEGDRDGKTAEGGGKRGCPHWRWARWRGGGGPPVGHQDSYGYQRSRETPGSRCQACLPQSRAGAPTGGGPAPQEPWPVFGDVFGCHKWAGCTCHLVGRGQGCCCMLYSSPTTEKDQLQMAWP